MARYTLRAALCIVALARAAALAAAPDPPPSASLLACLEPIARAFNVRIVDASGFVGSIACVQAGKQNSLDEVLDRLLKPHRLGWRHLDDGTIEVIAAQQTSRVDLPALAIDGDPVPEVVRPDHPLATPLVERATASTSLDQRWLGTAPLLGFNQLAWYAPNVYGSGQSLAIRGSERDTDYFPALTVTFDGIELGTRLLDDELVPLEDITNLDLARGPRTFEAGEGAQAGAIALKTAAPAAEPSMSATAGIGNQGAWNGAIAWSGPLAPDLGATIAVDEHDLPSFVRQRAVPEADVENRRNDFGRIKLRYTPDSGFSAQLAALALTGDSSDRQVVVSPARAPGQPVPGPFDPFDRDSYASNPIVARTYARGAAGFVRYEQPDCWSIDAHASVTTIARQSTQWPHDRQWSDDELRRRLGVTASDHPAPDWTIVAGLERDHVSTSVATPLPAGQLFFNYFAASTDSASIWVEHAWGGTWNAGFGVRSSHENATMFTGNDHAYEYRVPIPMATVEWLPSKDQALTLSYGTGYRNGGQIDAAANYNPERSRNLELSWRAQWLGGMVHTTLSAFDGQIRDRYTYYLSDLGQPILASVRDRGIEFEVDAELADRWRLRAGVGVLNSHYSSLAFRYGDPTSEAPPQTATFGVRYGRPDGWYAAADAYHAAAARYYDPNGRLPAYDVLSFRFGYRASRWETALIAANALDARYIERVQLSAANETGFRLGDPRRIELLGKWTW
jgi:iron complex outermembrane receptor protein